MKPPGQFLRAFLSRDRIAARFAPLTRGMVPVFMLHRFTDPETGVTGHPPAGVRELLAFLRRNRYNVVSVRELSHRLASDAGPVRKTVAFTVDDGYADFGRVGAPIFHEYDCPVTVFLSTGFLDGVSWLWWNQIAFACQKSPRRSAVLEVGGQPLTLNLSDSATRRWASNQLVAKLKQQPEEVRLFVIESVPAILDVELPSDPPARYAPMTWAAVRAAAAQGIVGFGPHTVTHPILSRTQAAQAEREIRESARRVREETDAFVPIFCYPNGDHGSFSVREIRMLRRLGFEGAVTSIYGYACAADFAAEKGHRCYTLPRAFAREATHMICIAAGIERCRDLFSFGR